MKGVISILVTLSTLLSAHLLQADLRINPEKYNLITVNTSEMPEPIKTPEKDDFIQLSEVNMHYQVYGNGKKTLILIHGNGGTVNSLHEAATYLANDYTVYVTESRCHGQSSDPGKISYDLIASDIVEFASAMNIQQPVIMGHSDGAIVAIAIAANYPDFPSAIIACGANSNPSAFWPYFTIGVKFNNLIKKDKLNDMMLNEPNFTKEYLAKITCPSYIICGEFDIMFLSDSVYLHESIANSDFAVIKGEDHGSYISRNGKKAYVIAKSWLGKTGGGI